MITSRQIEAAAESVFESLPQAYVSGMLTSDEYERASEAAMAKLDRYLNQTQSLRMREGIAWALSGEVAEPVWFS